MKLLLVVVAAFVTIAAAQDQQPAVKAVHFKVLQQYLPAGDIPGYTRSKPIGSTNNSMGYSVSEASVRYTMPTDSMEYSIQIKITDMAFLANTMWAAAYQQMNYENETEEGYEKTVTVGASFKGIEKATTSDSKSCSLSFAVGNRYNVELSYNGSDDVKKLYDLAKSMKLDALAKQTGDSK